MDAEDALLAAIADLRNHLAASEASAARLRDERDEAWAEIAATKLALPITPQDTLDDNRLSTRARFVVASLRAPSVERERDGEDTARLEWLADNVTSVSDGYGPNGELMDVWNSTHGRVDILAYRLPTVPRETKGWFRAAIDRARQQAAPAPGGTP